MRSIVIALALSILASVVVSTIVSAEAKECKMVNSPRYGKPVMVCK